MSVREHERSKHAGGFDPSHGGHDDAELADHDEAEPPGHDLGLAHDLATLSRRRLLAIFGGTGLFALAGCVDDTAGPSIASSPASTPASATAGETSTTASAPGGTAEIPEETAGPFPGNGSNGPNVLDDSGIVRSDLTRSLPPSTGVAEGVPLTIELRLVDVSGGTGAPLPGRAIYLWHCTREGGYSMYSNEVRDENFLRGVQASDSNGLVRFQTIFPGCYSGRWPHAHFEVYESAEAATSGGRKLRTSQLALPADACRAVYQSDGYEGSQPNFERVSLDSDMVFADGYSLQLAKVTGSVANGFTAILNVAI